MGISLSPRTIALGHLIDLYANSEMSAETRQQLCLLLIDQVSLQPAASVIEPPCSALRKALEPLPATLRDSFEQRLIEHTEPDDLDQIYACRQELVESMRNTDRDIGAINDYEKKYRKKDDRGRRRSRSSRVDRSVRDRVVAARKSSERKN